MRNEPVFLERQKFKQWWIWIALIGLFAITCFNIYQMTTLPNLPSGAFNTLLLSTVVLLLVAFLFLSARLDTAIKPDGIQVRFFPFHLKAKNFAWDDLEKCYLRTYSPLLEYGGWGVRFKLFRNSVAYNVAGNEGLQLELKSGRKVLIGTAKSEQLKDALIKLGKLKP